jgi:hypothetical protein
LGNITRIDNALDALPSRGYSCKEQLNNARNQRENAKVEAAKPFDKEDELIEKSARLAELDALLNMDERGSEVADDDRADMDSASELVRERFGDHER